ncbi:MAG TPA: PadR family transcriptional regulator [Candidatus Paceibacterota bacterium]|nr:PadR family transcriptional regulator [Candidatus Paceibacterota bacterium]
MAPTDKNKADKENEEKLAPLRKGLLEMAVLKVVSSKAAYAADILERLNSTPFKTQEGTLYPLLSKLRREELVKYEWVESEAGPPRKYYSLTKDGEATLKELSDYFKTLQTAINNINK